MISRAWKCLILWRISTVGGAFKQEKAREKKKKGGRGRGLKRFRSHIKIKSRIWSTLMFTTLCAFIIGDGGI